MAPDRLRQPLPRLAGDVAALPLPVAGEGQPALVDLLRGDQAADAADARLGAVLRRARGGPASSRASSPRTPRSRGSGSRPTRFEEFCAKHLGHLDEVLWEFFGTDIAKDAVRQKVAALFPRTRSSSSPSCSGAASRVAGRRTRRLMRARAMKEWTHAGTRRASSATSRSCAGATTARPSCVFPTAGGDAEEIERFHLSTRVGELLDAGRVKLYCCDSVAGRVLLAGEGDARHRMWHAEPVPRVRPLRGGARPSAATASRRTSRSSSRARRSARSTRSPCCAGRRTCSAPPCA